MVEVRYNGGHRNISHPYLTTALEALIASS